MHRPSSITVLLTHKRSSINVLLNHRPSTISLGSVLLLLTWASNTQALHVFRESHEWGACTMIREYSSVKRYDPPLPATEDYSQESATEDLILHYLQRLWFSTTSEILLEHQTIYTDYLPSGRCFCWLAFAWACATAAECREQKAKSPPYHSSPERKTSPLREIVWANKEKQSSQEFRRRFFDTLFSEDCSIEISHMMFEYLSIFCSV